MSQLEIHADLRLAYDVAGEGPPLLLIGGLSADRAFWSLARPGLNGFTTIAFDNRDVGLSDRVFDPYAAADMARDALAILDHAGIKRAHVLGHSLGGVVAQELALLAPERVDRLVLACTFARNDLYSRGILELLKRVRAEVVNPVTYVRTLATFTLGRCFLEANDLERLARQVVAAGPLQGVAAFHRQADASLAADTLARLGAIMAPTLVMATPQDRIFAPAFGREIAAAIPGALFLEGPDTGHCPMIEAPDAFAQIVTAFLRGDPLPD